MFLPPPRTWLSACFAPTTIATVKPLVAQQDGRSSSYCSTPTRTNTPCNGQGHVVDHGRLLKFLHSFANTHALFASRAVTLPLALHPPLYHRWAHLPIFCLAKDLPLPQCFWYLIPRVLFNFISLGKIQTCPAQKLLYTKYTYLPICYGWLFVMVGFL